jgi:hypothetical protein
MDPTVLVEVIGVIALGILCLVSAISSWQTRRHLMTVFGENPRPAQLSSRGYYLWLPEQAPPAAAPPGSSGARALAPAVEPAVEPGATSTPAPSPREEPELRGEHAPETTRKPGAAPSSRKHPAVPASTDLATLARDLDNADQAQADQAPERRVPIEGPPHKPPHFVRKATLLGNLEPSVVPPPMIAPVSARPLPAVTPPPVRAVPSSQSALAATVAVTARIVSANGGDNAEGAATVARPDSLPTAAPDDFDDENEATRVLDLPTAEELALDKQLTHGRAKTLVSASAGVPSSARREPDVKVIGADTPSKPGDTSAPVVVR